MTHKVNNVYYITHPWWKKFIDSEVSPYGHNLGLLNSLDLVNLVNEKLEPWQCFLSEGGRLTFETEKDYIWFVLRWA